MSVTALPLKHHTCIGGMALRYVTTSEAARTLGVCQKTLRNWEKAAKIKVIRTFSGLQRFDIDFYVDSRVQRTKTTIAYARVSGRKQKETLGAKM